MLSQKCHYTCLQSLCQMFWSRSTIKSLHEEQFLLRLSKNLCWIVWCWYVPCNCKSMQGPQSVCCKCWSFTSCRGWLKWYRSLPDSTSQHILLCNINTSIHCCHLLPWLLLYIIIWSHKCTNQLQRLQRPNQFTICNDAWASLSQIYLHSENQSESDYPFCSNSAYLRPTDKDVLCISVGTINDSDKGSYVHMQVPTNKFFP